jgi:hypothetical protein
MLLCCTGTPACTQLCRANSSWVPPDAWLAIGGSENRCFQLSKTTSVVRRSKLQASSETLKGSGKLLTVCKVSSWAFEFFRKWKFRLSYRWLTLFLDCWRFYSCKLAFFCIGLQHQKLGSVEKVDTSQHWQANCPSQYNCSPLRPVLTLRRRHRLLY